MLLANITPDIDDEEPVEVYRLPPIPTPPATTNAPEAIDVATCVFVILVVPPIKAFPVIPNPPVTVSAPDVVLAELVKFVTAKPDTVTNPVDGFTTNDVIVDNPRPD